MSLDQNFRELSVNVISGFTICTNREFQELQLSLFYVILGEKLANFQVIFREIAEITGIGCQWDFAL